MKTIQIYDPAMCCSSGVCGIEVDQTLVNLAEREAQYLSDAEERHQQHEARMAAARSSRQAHVGKRRQLS